MPGAEFKLVDSDGKTIVESIVTDKDGKVTVDVPLVIKKGEDGKPISLSNEFKLIETKAPAGHELATEEIPVEIVYGKVTNVTVSNEATPEKPVDPNEPEKPTVDVDVDTEENPNDPNGGEKPVVDGDTEIDKTETNQVEKPTVAGDKEENKLPQKGEAVVYGATALGLVLLLIGAAILRRKKTA